MCGIAGIIRFDGSPVDSDDLDRLTDGLAHRGPDGRGTVIAANVGLGHRRLSILDLSVAASQPMITEDQSLAIVFNGEIYNFQELRSALQKKGYTFRSTGDTEVLLALYREYGEQCLDHCRGMFAFAIHDRTKQTLFLARDRVGKKPLKYFMNGSMFAFASELKALRTLPECPKGMSEEAIHHYLTMMYVPSPETGIAGIRKLPAGHSLMIDLKTGKHTLKKYWSLTYKTDRSKSLDQWKKEILETFQESVRLRMIADVPVGAFLSGGIDSAAVVCVMSQLSSRPVETFSIGSPEETHNELPDAERIAKLFRTNHHPIELRADIVHLLPEIVRTYEEPYADPSAIPTYLLARETRKFVTVALNGDGGDENFAGYHRYPILQFSEVWRRLPIHFLMRPLLRGLHVCSGTTLSYRMQRFESTIGLPWAERFLQYISFFTEDEKRALYRSGFAHKFPATGSWYAQTTSDARSSADTMLHQAMNMDLSTYLADDLLPKVDLGSMASGLEARSPFLDHKLLELTATLPSEYQLRGWNTKKWILKEILKDYLPAETLAKKKSGFRLPLDRWFRSDLKSFVTDRLLSEHSPLWRIFDRAAMKIFLTGYFASRVDFSDHIWSLLYLDEWLVQYGND
ncbi:asparagine synthase (glutamine-hydrolyzing) [Candidatus Peribacteria bacterium]|nr:asparagine synthase (glutamine-hydrolyzing) [Candidatus Peribacteria bacterium]